MTPTTIQRGGGYRRLDAFMMASIIDLATTEYCNRFLPYQQDAQGKQRAQMQGAARSVRQNIIEGTERGETSRETEIRLLEVARGSMAELLGDFEMLMIRRGEMPWAKDSADYQAVKAIPFHHGEPIADDDFHAFRPVFDRLYHQLDPWLAQGSAETWANVILVLGVRTMASLRSLVNTKMGQFSEEGGFREKLTRIRLEQRDARARQKADEPPPPVCPACGKPMVLRTAKTGPNVGKKFWAAAVIRPARQSRRSWNEGKTETLVGPGYGIVHGGHPADHRPGPRAIRTEHRFLPRADVLGTGQTNPGRSAAWQAPGGLWCPPVAQSGPSAGA